MLGIFTELRHIGMQGGQRNWAHQQHPPLRSPQLTAAPSDLSPGLEGRETARGLDLPVMPYDRPLPSLTPSNMTPSEGLNAYWLKNQIKRLGRRCPRKLSATFFPGGNKERFCEKKGNGRSLGLSSYKNNK